jgi:hypothetical protein
MTRCGQNAGTPVGVSDEAIAILSHASGGLRHGLGVGRRLEILYHAFVGKQHGRGCSVLGRSMRTEIRRRNVFTGRASSCVREPGGGVKSGIGAEHAQIGQPPVVP